MGITTISSREFNQDSGKAKRAAADGPVFITDRGTPSHVLLTIEEYRRLAGEGPTWPQCSACLACPTSTSSPNSTDL